MSDIQDYPINVFSETSCYNTNGGFNNTAGALARQLDGKILVGGSFTQYSGFTSNYIINLNTDGTINTSFNIGAGFNNAVTDIKIQTDGKILVAGYFTSYSGVSINRIIRLNTNATIDNTFTIGLGLSNYTTYAPNKMTLQPDGKIIVTGGFTTYSGVTANRIVRLNTDGTIDNTFNTGTGFNNSTFESSLQTDGKIIVVGYFTSYSGTSRNRIIRLNSDGSIDNTFNIGTGFNGTFVTDVTLQSDEKILVAGGFTTYSGVSKNRIVRLNTDGAIDNTFTIGLGFNSGTDFDISIQPDNKILVGGEFSSYSGYSANKFIRLNVDGTIDPTFNMDTSIDISAIYDSEILDSGKIIVVGYFTSTSSNMIHRIFSGGSIDNCAVVTPTPTITPTITPTNLPIYKIIVINTDPICENSIENIISGVTDC